METVKLKHGKNGAIYSKTQTPKQRLSKRQPGCHPDSVFAFINVFMIFFPSSADAT